MKKHTTRTTREHVLLRQLEFMKRKRVGCLFAAIAATNPLKYGWVHKFPAVAPDHIDDCIAGAIDDASVTTLSMLFPSIRSLPQLLRLLEVLNQCKLLLLESADEFEGSICFAYRARVGDLVSYVTGFGDFKFLPKTRQTPCVELTMRVKPRPNYDFVFKEAPPNVVHLADLDMHGMKRERLWGLWNGSFVQTKRILEEAPDIRSAARTTFSIPMVHTRAQE